LQPVANGPKPRTEQFKDFRLEDPDPRGLDPEGLDPEGLDRTGLGLGLEDLDPEALDRTGLGPADLDRTGFGPEGLGPEGLDPEGLDRSGLGPKGLGPEDRRRGTPHQPIHTPQFPRRVLRPKRIAQGLAAPH